jgi:hypothetical protein
VDTTHVYIEAPGVPEVNDSTIINIDQIGLIVVANKLKPRGNRRADRLA